MQNLLEFLQKYHHWFLFVVLEIISLVLLFQYNSYQGSVFSLQPMGLSGVLTRVGQRWNRISRSNV